MGKFDDIIKRRANIAKRNICFLDDTGRVVEEKNATKFIITEYDSEGNVINEIFGKKEKMENRDEEER